MIYFRCLFAQPEPCLLNSDKTGHVFVTQAAPPSFQLSINGFISNNFLTPTFVSPGEPVTLKVIHPNPSLNVQAAFSEGTLEDKGENQWEWQAPSKPGWYFLCFKDSISKTEIRLHAAVIKPYAGEKVISGYPIGKYESKPLRNDPHYLMPKGFVRVMEKEKDLWISPHLKVSQFFCKQSVPFPKFLVLNERLILKLEMIISALQKQGMKNARLELISGYRTPQYNKNIGNETKFSRHLYGDAADIFVDADFDHQIDDLNGDGISDRKDGEWLASFIEKFFSGPLYTPYAGGLSVYDVTKSHTSFVHVDVRGHHVKW